MSRAIKIDVEMLASMTDDEIRSWLLENAARNNYAYTIQVCRQCGSYQITEAGNARTAKIVKVCRNCIKIPE